MLYSLHSPFIYFTWRIWIYHFNSPGFRVLQTDGTKPVTAFGLHCFPEDAQTNGAVEAWVGSRFKGQFISEFELLWSRNIFQKKPVWVPFVERTSMSSSNVCSRKIEPGTILIEIATRPGIVVSSMSKIRTRKTSVPRHIDKSCFPFLQIRTLQVVLEISTCRRFKSVVSVVFLLSVVFAATNCCQRLFRFRRLK